MKWLGSAGWFFCSLGLQSLGLSWAGTTEMAHSAVIGSSGQDFLWGSSLGLRRHERLLFLRTRLVEGTGGRQSKKPAPKCWVAGTPRQRGWLECWRAEPFFLSFSIKAQGPFSLLWLLHGLFQQVVASLWGSSRPPKHKSKICHGFWSLLPYSIG